MVTIFLFSWFEKKNTNNVVNEGHTQRKSCGDDIAVRIAVFYLE